MKIKPACNDEKIWVIGKGMRLGKLDEWSFDFMKSVMGQRKRRRNWKPSTKQISVIDRLYHEVRNENVVAVQGSLIDHEDTLAMRGG